MDILFTNKNISEYNELNKFDLYCKLINSYVNYFDLSDKLLKIKHSKNKSYKIEDYIKYVVYVYISGISWRHLIYIKMLLCCNNKNIDIPFWNSVYKFSTKLTKLRIFEKIYKLLLNGVYFNKGNEDKYLKLKYQSIDATFIGNKCGSYSIVGRNYYYYNKFGVKVTIIVDINGIALNVIIHKATVNDAKITIDLFNKQPLIDTLLTTEASKNNKYKQYLLADAGYDTNKIRELLKNKKYVPIIYGNKRNTKDPAKLKAKKFTEQQKTIYKKRVIVEHVFSKIKNGKFTKIYNKSYEPIYELFFFQYINVLMTNLAKENG